MDFDNFKEQFTEDVGKALYDRGIDAAVTTYTVEKMNESYEALTITPEGSHVGVNLNMDRFFEAYENGVSYDEVLSKATDVADQGIKESPAVDIASLTNYDIMKEKLAMEVVSIEANAELLGKIPHAPMFPVLADKEAFTEYLVAYEKLLISINSDFSKIWQIAPSNAKEIVNTIISMDNIFVEGENNFHAMPTPLNPLFLWKYIKLADEILDSKGVESTEEGSLSDDDKNFIIRKADDIPDPLSVMLLPATVHRSGGEFLPLTGRIGNIPIYSINKQIDQKVLNTTAGYLMDGDEMGFDADVMQLAMMLQEMKNENVRKVAIEQVKVLAKLNKDA